MTEYFAFKEAGTLVSDDNPLPVSHDVTFPSEAQTALEAVQAAVEDGATEATLADVLTELQGITVLLTAANAKLDDIVTNTA